MKIKVIMSRGIIGDDNSHTIVKIDNRCFLIPIWVEKNINNILECIHIEKVEVDNNSRTFTINNKIVVCDTSVLFTMKDNRDSKNLMLRIRMANI